jgi:glycosyltransferase involved in cell wall biosynthesis
MNIMWVLPYAPTPIRTRPYNLIRSLVERGHQLTLAVVWETEEEQVELERLAATGVKVVSEKLDKLHSLTGLGQAMFTGKPLQSRYSWIPRLADRMVYLLDEEHFDAVHVEHLRGAEFGLTARKVLGGRGKAGLVVWDSVDCISLLFEQARRNSRSGFGRWVTSFELPRTRKYERYLVEVFRKTLVTAPNDKLVLEHLAGKALPQVEVLPNGVDLEYFCPIGTPKTRNEVVFSGKLSYHANVSAALHLVKQVMPRVWAERPEVKVVLAGKDPAPVLCQLARNDPRVEVTGSLPDLRPILRRVTVAATLVTYGAGIQNKVLEAMACGTPVIASSQAISGLNTAASQAVFVSDGIQEQAKGILQVLNDEVLQRKLAEAGRAFVETWHDWQKVTEKLVAVYQSGLKAPSG